MPTFVFRRDATYYFRRIVPERLRPQFEGKRELVFSLKTKDRSTAGRLGRLEAVKSDRLFEQAETNLAAARTPEIPAAVSLKVPQRASRLKASWRRERELYAAQGLLPAFEDRLRDAIADHEAIRRGDYPDLPPSSLDSSEAMLLAARAILTGEGAASLPEILPMGPGAPPEGSMLSLTQLTDKWSDEVKPTDKSVQMWRRTCRRMDDFSGALPAGKITKRVVLDFKDQMLADGASASTANNRLNQLRSLFRYAIANDLLAVDPTVGVRAPVAKRAIESRIPFDPVALNTLFDGPVHSQGLRPLKGGGEASYWLPLLALFTGARLNELGQLRTSDVMEEAIPHQDGEDMIWVVRITADKTDGLRLKNTSSARRVPVHSSLVDLGFLDYHQAMKKRGETRLFPALKPDSFGTVTAHWGKWFGKYLRELGVKDRRIVFHSFRHSFKHYARECGITKNVNDALTGHESGDVADTYGGLQYPLKPLAEAISHYRIVGFHIPKPPSNYI